MEASIYPCLLFDGNAKEAANFYCSVFNNSRITIDTPLIVNFELGGQKFMGLNGGPKFTPNPSISFFVVCETEMELLDIWANLVKEGSVLMPLDKYAWSKKYGWVQDRFGISWQLCLGNLANVGQKFTPTLMFTKRMAGKAEDAIVFYTSIFHGSSIKEILRYTTGDHDVEGMVKHAQFSLAKMVFMAMDSSIAHAFSFNEGVSLVIECDNQSEVDYYWNRLTEEGEESMCGWLRDPYGVSWQIVPTMIRNLMGADASKSTAVMNAIMKMKKLDIKQLVDAYENA